MKQQQSEILKDLSDCETPVVVYLDYLLRLHSTRAENILVFRLFYAHCPPPILLMSASEAFAYGVIRI